jgi:hypothetical protein
MSNNHLLIFYCLLAFSLSSCASKTQINLFSANLDKNQITNITRVIDPAIFNLTTNQVRFPESINKNTLIYTPTLNSNQHVSALIKTLAEIGYDITTVSLLHRDNQTLTENNIALYLVPADYKPLKTSVIENIINEYGSSNCQHTSNLYLKENGVFRIEVDLWLPKEERYGEYIVKGGWQKDNREVIQLTSEKWHSTLTFSRVFSFENTPYGKRHVVSLKPLNQEKTPKNYLIEKDNNIPNINCTYTISLVI